jgi:hypothetical protein
VGFADAILAEVRIVLDVRVVVVVVLVVAVWPLTTGGGIVDLVAGLEVRRVDMVAIRSEIEGVFLWK